MSLTLASSAFTEGARIPVRHTADGEDLNPALSWGQVPPACRALALICDDPDAPVGTWVHWVIFNLPAGTTNLPEGVPDDPQLRDGSAQGRNSWGRVGYNGPSPPRGKPHRYVFTLYALDASLALDSHANKKDLVAAMSGHVLAEGQLIGLYGR